MSGLLDLDDVAAGHPLATSELFTLRRRLDKLNISEEEMRAEFDEWHIKEFGYGYARRKDDNGILLDAFRAGIKTLQERCK